MSITIGHVMPTYLPRTETFTHALISSMRDVRHRIFTTRVENLDAFPTTDLVPAASEDEYPALAAAHGVDLLLAHFGPSGIAALPAAIVNRLPLVTIFHGYDMSMVLRDPKWVARYEALFRFSAHAITVCEAGRQRLVDAGLPADRISTCHLGVDPTAFAYRDRPVERFARRTTRLLMVSRLTEKKGIQTALKALQRGRADGGRQTLTVIGDGELKAHLESLRSRLQLDDAVRFAGSRTSSEVAQAMSGADILLAPSITASNGDCEGIPIALMEAMASGLPVISTRHSGIPELIVDRVSGLLVDEGDAASLAVAIRALEEDAHLRDGVAWAARRRIEQCFNVATQANAYSETLRAVRSGWRPDEPIAAAPDTSSQGGTLFVRAAPVAHALAQLTSLTSRPEEGIEVLTTADPAMEQASRQVASQVHALPAGRMHLATFDPDLLKRLRSRAFSRVVVGCATTDLTAYQNVFTIASALRPDAVIAMLPNLQQVTVGPDGVAA